MKYTNAYIYQSGYGFRHGSFTVEDGRFSRIEFGEETIRTDAGIDLGGRYVIPGLVDIHIHGCAGADCADADPDGLRDMGTYLASRGVTSFCPTLPTLSADSLKKACSVIAEMMGATDERQSDGERAADEPDGRTKSPARGYARIAGLRLEGPYLSPERPGSQNPDNLCKPNREQFMELYEISRGGIGILDIAPELDGATDLISEASGMCTVSLAHTEADYETSLQAFEAGASHVTHLYNAMPGIHHRAPGVIGAASESEKVTTEIICDGIHVHPGSVRMAFKLFPGRICLISDALRCCGMPDGEYEFGGQVIRKADGAAWLEAGVLAGSANDLWQNMCNAVDFGIDLSDAIDASTITPAIVAGVSESIGSISEGKLADFIVCDRDLKGPVVYIGGLPAGTE